MRQRLEDGVQQGILPPENVGAFMAHVGATAGRAEMTAAVVRVDGSQITVRTFIRKEQDVFFVGGEEVTLEVPLTALVERSWRTVVALGDIQPGEIVRISSRDCQNVDLILATGVKWP